MEVRVKQGLHKGHKCVATVGREDGKVMYHARCLTCQTMAVYENVNGQWYYRKGDRYLSPAHTHHKEVQDEH